MAGVEAAAISAIVSATLKTVGNKLAQLLIRTYSSIVGVKEDLEELHGLILEINYWLETIAGNANASRVPFAWLQKLKDISYDVDDVVDEFQLKAEKHDSDGDGGIVSKYLCTMPKSFVFQCKAANKIKAIKKRFSTIVKQRTDYLAITNSLSVGPHVQPTNMRTNEVPALLPNVDEALVVGRDKDKLKIISMLQENDDQQEIKTVSIIGLGGSGKTTLAKLVFNDGNIIENHFNVRLWVHVSQEFNLKDLIKKLFEAFSDNNPGPHALPYMTKTISDKLAGKRFLLVLDDVWTDSRDEWEEFMIYIKGGAPKSRILLTTRNREVAVIVGSTDQFHLPFLSSDDSWQLFQQSLVIPATSWSSEFEEVGKEIVDKCGGMPLAIKVLAGALHGKDRIEEWKGMRDKTNVNVQGERVTACLRLSYFHLPSNLKQCFAICSVFPKGQKIDKEQLIDLWIAHDMITLEDGVDSLDLEYVGHKHFNSLLQVSFLQNVKEECGRVTCGMHDLVHDLALSILGDEISLDMPKEASSSTTKSYRYFSLIKQTKHMAPKIFFRKARVVYMPRYEDHTYGMALKNAKHLRSITVKYLNAEGGNAISQVKYLKYLAVSELDCGTLPEGISDVWSLQALHVTNSFLFEITESIGKLKMLRTLNLSGCAYIKRLPDSIGDCEMVSSIDLCRCSMLTALPDSIGKLQKLRTLNLSWCKEVKCLPDSIGKLLKLETLNLSWCKEVKCLPDSIGKLLNLGTLNLSWCIEMKCLPNSIGDCHMISSIDLCGCMKLIVLPDSIGKLQKLRTLNLSRCRRLKCLPNSIGDCLMISSINLKHCNDITVLPDSISRNEKLRVLRLGYTAIERLPSFRTLRNMECLDLRGCCELVELPEGIGNLDKLQVLNLKGCKKLEGMPVGIGQLTRVQKLGLFVVGNGEKFAEISELANVSRMSEELWIRGISHVLDPNDAHMACLKQMTHLQGLVLDWMCMANDMEEMSADDMEEVNTDDIEEANIELQQDVLNGLEAPPGIEALEIQWYSGRQYARWMLNQVGRGVQGPAPFPSLRAMSLFGFRFLEHLDGLVELPCLELLHLEWMPSLESISGGPFPSLVRLDMYRLPRLGEVWMVAEGTMPDGEVGGVCRNFTPQLGQFRVGNFLTELDIRDCPKLEVKPHLPPSLQRLSLWCSELLLQSPGQCQGSSSFPCFSHLKKLELGNMSLESGKWKLLQYMTALEKLDINFCYGLTELPESMGSLTSLRSLKQCSAICMLPQSIGHLYSLQELRIRYCHALEQLLESLGELPSLCILEITNCPGLTSLPEGMKGLSSLEDLRIEGCQEIKSLPEGIKDLTALKTLRIKNCPGLTSLPEGMKGLSSLEDLRIKGCQEIKSLPEGIKDLTALKTLRIKNCPGLTSLPEGMKGLSSLEDLKIEGCQEIKSLPEGIKDLTALKTLRIESCPSLSRRCERRKGDDWHLVSHIPKLWIS